MKLDLILNFEIFGASRSGGTMSDWSKKAAERFQTNKDTKLIRDKKILHDADICKQRSEDLWDQLTGKFAEECMSFNSEPGMTNTFSFSRNGSRQFTLSREGMSHNIKGEFDPTNSRFNFISSTWKLPHFRIEVRVPEGSSEAIMVAENGASIDLDGFVTDHLDSLLGIS